jgi:Cytochrome P460
VRIVFYGAGRAPKMQRIASRMQRTVWLMGECGAILTSMISKAILGLFGMAMVAAPVYLREYATPPSTPPSVVPEYTDAGEMKLPDHYREWVYLTTGFDMSYNPEGMQMGHHMFDNVFVNPEAYRAFVETGKWPDKTTFVLEGRRAEGRGSINQKGNYQGSDVMGVEVHVKDEARFPGKWAFFGFGDGKTAKMIPTTATCYSCHSDHGAVDTTFVQFYPTLLPIAKSKGTLAEGYLKEMAVPVQK